MVMVFFANYSVVADEIDLLNLATHPWRRRAGHASRLLAHIVEFGRQQRLPVSSRSRCGARTPRRCGFIAASPYRPVGVRPNYYAEDQKDAIVMLLDVTLMPRRSPHWFPSGWSLRGVGMPAAPL